jgi:hypothetical protein
MTNKETQTVTNEAQEWDELNEVQKLELQVLQLRKLHAAALQMLVKMGRNLLANQQLLLNTVGEMRERYQELSNFLDVNAAHLPEPPAQEDDVTEQ